MVFLDEITTGLDPQARRTTWEAIEKLRQEGKTVVLVTHFMDEAQQLCDRVRSSITAAWWRWNFPRPWWPG